MITSTRYIYERVGYGSRAMIFGSDGTIVRGRAAMEDKWTLDNDTLTILDHTGSVTCKLKKSDDGSYKGQWTRFEKCDVILRPSLKQANFALGLW